MATQAQKSLFNAVYGNVRARGYNHVQATLAASQAAHESGGDGKAPGNSYFGIKGNYKGKSVNFTTHENAGDKINDNFRAYSGLEQAITDYISQMERNWSSSWNAPDLNTAAKNLQHGRIGSYGTHKDNQGNWIYGDLVSNYFDMAPDEQTTPSSFQTNTTDDIAARAPLIDGYEGNPAFSLTADNQVIARPAFAPADRPSVAIPTPAPRATLGGKTNEAMGMPEAGILARTPARNPTMRDSAINSSAIDRVMGEDIADNRISMALDTILGDRGRSLFGSRHSLMSRKPKSLFQKEPEKRAAQMMKGLIDGRPVKTIRDRVTTPALRGLAGSGLYAGSSGRQPSPVEPTGVRTGVSEEAVTAMKAGTFEPSVALGSIADEAPSGTFASAPSTALSTDLGMSSPMITADDMAGVAAMNMDQRAVSTHSPSPSAALARDVGPAQTFSGPTQTLASRGSHPFGPAEQASMESLAASEAPVEAIDVPGSAKTLGAPATVSTGRGRNVGTPAVDTHEAARQRAATSIAQTISGLPAEAVTTGKTAGKSPGSLLGGLFESLAKGDYAREASRVRAAAPAGAPARQGTIAGARQAAAVRSGAPAPARAPAATNPIFGRAHTTGDFIGGTPAGLSQGGGAGATKHLCTLSYENGVIPEDVFVLDNRFSVATRLFCPELYRGYSVWAAPLASWLRKHPAFAPPFMALAACWARHMAWRMEPSKHRFSAAGAILNAVGTPICRIIGKLNG